MSDDYWRGYRAALEEALTLTAERIAEMSAHEARAGGIATREVLRGMLYAVPRYRTPREAIAPAMSSGAGGEADDDGRA